MTWLILSDLHLGAGDALEDFLLWGPEPSGPADRAGAVAALDGKIAQLLESRQSTMNPDDGPQRLLLLGDIFDLWHVQRPRESVRDALMRILFTHGGFVAALRGWIAGGGRLVYVLGNHDHPLVEPRAWELIREVFPGINVHAEGRPVHFYADEECSLYAEHGHQWDPLNRLRSFTNPHADCAGRRIVRQVVNRLEPMFPLLDKGTDLRDLLEELWRAGVAEGVPLWQEVAGHLARLVGHGAGPAALVQREIARWREAPDQVPDFSAAAQRRLRLEEKALRRAISPRPGGSTGPLPKRLRFIASGHTHRALLTEVLCQGRTITRINPGTWRPIASREAEGLVLRQTLTYAMISRIGGAWAAALEEA